MKKVMLSLLCMIFLFSLQVGAQTVTKKYKSRKQQIAELQEKNANLQQQLLVLQQQNEALQQRQDSLSTALGYNQAVQEGLEKEKQNLATVNAALTAKVDSLEVANKTLKQKVKQKASAPKKTLLSAFGSKKNYNCCLKVEDEKCLTWAKEVFNAHPSTFHVVSCSYRNQTNDHYASDIHSKEYYMYTGRAHTTQLEYTVNNSGIQTKVFEWRTRWDKYRD